MRASLAALATAALLPTLAQAQAVPVGRLLVSNCFQCHGTHGKGPGFDKLAGKASSENYKALVEFSSGNEGNGVMAKAALGYTDAQLRALSNCLPTQR